MKKFVLFIFLTAIITSCIPTKIAPRFKNEDYKVMQAKKFERNLPRETSFIFKDPKDADEFYKDLLPQADSQDHQILRQAMAGMIWTKQF